MRSFFITALYGVFIIFTLGCQSYKAAQNETSILGSSGSSDPSENSGNTPIFNTLSEAYPGDNWPSDDPAIIFATGFENGISDWDQVNSYSGDRIFAQNNFQEAHSGNYSLVGEIALEDLESRGYASVRARKIFDLPQSNIFYVRYYTRLDEGTARPHHGGGFRVFSEGNNIGGTAGQRPAGDQRFNAAIDLNGNGEHFFYTYWHEMRSWMCNDGSTDPNCAGYNGPSSSPYYGNNFKPRNQPRFDMHQWSCIEYRVRVNTPNEYDGELTLWVNNSHLGTFREGEPDGAWLRENFYLNGEWGTGDRQVPFEGFNFRTSENVNIVQVKLEHYQQWNTLSNRRGDTPIKASTQRVLFDDVVIATERIGCRVN